MNISAQRKNKETIETKSGNNYIYMCSSFFVLILHFRSYALCRSISSSSHFQQSLQTHSDSFLHESQLLHEKDVLAREKKLFYEEKAHFEEERKLFTEAAIKLGREVRGEEGVLMTLLQCHEGRRGC